MKSRLGITIGVILVFACVTQAWAQDNPGMKAKVNAHNSQLSTHINAGDIDGFLSLFADDFQIIMAGLDREETRSLLKLVFLQYDQIRATYTPLEISEYVNSIKAVRDEKIMGTSSDAVWKEISNKWMIDYLIQLGLSSLATVLKIGNPDLTEFVEKYEVKFRRFPDKLHSIFEVGVSYYMEEAFLWHARRKACRFRCRDCRF